MDYIVLDFGYCSCSQGNNRNIREIIAQKTKPSVFRSEIMAPFRDAMRFIYSEQGYFQHLEEWKEIVRCKTFRRNIQELVLARKQADFHVLGLDRRHGTVDARGSYAVDAKGVHLVLHQRDQRRHHDCYAGLHQGRQLVAERLAAACRHQDDDVPACKNVVDYLFLRRVERGISEMLLEQFKGLHFIRMDGKLLFMRFAPVNFIAAALALREWHAHHATSK